MTVLSHQYVLDSNELVSFLVKDTIVQFVSQLFDSFIFCMASIY